MCLVVEEKQICRSALSQILAECRGGGAPSFASSLAEAMDRISAVRPRVTLVDLFTANYDFPALKRLIVHAHPGLVIVVDDRANPTFTSLARDAGAVAYLTKDAEVETFKHAIRDALADQAGRAIEGPASAGLWFPPLARGLSARQLEVLGQLALGKSNQEIAAALGISVGTVKAHVHSVLALIGARNRTHAALLAGAMQGRPHLAPPSLPA